MFRPWRSFLVILSCLALGSGDVNAGEASTQQGLAIEAMKKKNFREAIDHCTRAIDSFPPGIVEHRDGGFLPFRPRVRLFDLHLQRSEAYSQLKEYGPALADLDAADKLSVGEDKQYQAFIGIGRASCQFELRRFDESIAELDRVARLAPDFADGCMMGEAGVLIAAGKLDEAAESLGRFAPKSKSRDEAEIFRAIIRLAQHDDDRAAREIDDLFRRSPRGVTILQARSVILMHQKKYAEAYQVASEEIRLAPRSSSGWSNRGAALAMMDRYPEALADAEEALRLDPRSPICFKNRASARKELGDERGAFDDLTRAAELKPGDAEIERRLAKLLARSREPSLRDLTRARELAERSVATTSRENPYCLQTLAVVLFEQGYYAEAAKTAEEALGHLPSKNTVEWDIHLGTDRVGIGFYMPYRDEEKVAKDLRGEIDRYKRIAADSGPRAEGIADRSGSAQDARSPGDPLVRPTTIDRRDP